MSPSEKNSQPLFFNDTLLSKTRLRLLEDCKFMAHSSWPLGVLGFVPSGFYFIQFLVQFPSPLLQLDVPFDKFSLINFIANQKKKRFMAQVIPTSFFKQEK